MINLERGDNMKMKLDDINVMAKYKNSPPSQVKINKKLKHYNRTGCLKPITLNSQNYIIFVWFCQ